MWGLSVKLWGQRSVLMAAAVAVLSINNAASALNVEQDNSLFADTIDEFMQASHERGLFNGNVLITRGDETIWQGSYGYFDGSRKRELDQSSVFEIGSIAKEFNAVAVMMLVEEGKIGLDDPVSKYFPDLPEWSRAVRVRNLLDYTSGVPRVKWEEVNNHADAFDDLNEVETLPFTPGKGYLYSNNNVFLQRMIIEKVTGAPFSKFVMDRILDPAGMENALIDPDVGTGNVVASFNNDFITDEPFPITIEGWVSVTADDMVKWLKALHSHKLVNKQSLDTLFTSYSPRQLGALGYSKYNENGDVEEHRHHGSSGNFEAFVTYKTSGSEDMTVILMTNNKNRKLFEITTALENIVEGRSYELPKKSIDFALSNACVQNTADCLIKYDQLKQSDPDLYDFDNEYALNEIGYRLLGNGDNEGAVTIFKKLVSEFPNSANPYDSLGEAYLKVGRLELALENYSKSLALNPENQHAAEVIEKLKAQLKNK
jgi:CubicO group peptidase (beta-lactamase class C family)